MWKWDDKTKMILLLVLTVAVLFLNIWNIGEFRCDDEYLYVKIAEEMYARGDIWTPIWLGEPAFYKPPLTYWLMMLPFPLTGPGLIPARIAIALTGLLTVYLLYLLARRLFGPEAAFNAGLLLATSFGFLVYGRVGMLDVPMMLFFVLAMSFLYRAFHESSPLQAALFWATAGGSALVKGPISTIILAFAALVFMAVYKKQRIFLNLKAAAGMALGLFFMALWPLAMLLKGKWDLWYTFFILRENLGKFADRVHYGFMDLAPYYLQHLLPWSFLFLAALVLVFMKGRFKEPRYLLPLLWIACTLLVFLLPATKLKHYLLPALPAGALLISGLWEEFKSHPLLKSGMIATSLVLGILSLALAAFLRLAAFPLPFLFLLGALASTIGAFVFLLKNRLRPPLVSYAVFLSFLILAGAFFTSPLLPAEAVPLSGPSSVPTGVARTQIYSFTYFLNRPVVQLQTMEEMKALLDKKGKVIISRSNLERFQRESALRPAYTTIYEWSQWRESIPLKDILAALKSGDSSALKEPVYLIER